ncbi:MAG: class I SAM-dependent RNA methyltransferase, partial [Chlamydiae bacterium]|nr:class I SAM-dependent RNA methyltransferase [Chlamydiota bacterium]
MYIICCMHDHSRHSIEVTVDGLSPKGFGKALWKKEGSLRPCTVLIPGGLPGDQLLVEICGRKKREYLGKLVNVLGPSLQRVEPRCKHVPVCGGCTLQAMSYEDQVRYKEHLILELFTPLGVQSIFPLVRDEDPWRYRNKMEFTFSQDVEGNRYLGLIRAGSKGRVEQLKECHLCPKWVESLLQRVYIWWQQSSLQAFHPNKGTGTLRTLIVREGRNTGQKMVMLTVSGNPAFACT